MVNPHSSVEAVAFKHLAPFSGLGVVAQKKRIEHIQVGISKEIHPEILG